jgi:hypothetical protein
LYVCVLTRGLMYVRRSVMRLSQRRRRRRSGEAQRAPAATHAILFGLTLSYHM